MGEESITDITYLVSSLLEKVQHLESKLQLLEKENGFLRYKLHQAELENSRLRERLSHDENPKKDSHNSHIPPPDSPSRQGTSNGQKVCVRNRRSLPEDRLDIPASVWNLHEKQAE